MNKLEFLNLYPLDFSEGKVKLLDFYKRLQEAIEKVPEEFRQSAEVDFYADHHYSVELTIEYERPETPEEARERRQQEIKSYFNRL